jgi:CBS-domain-containing membrane protein
MKILYMRRILTRLGNIAGIGSERATHLEKWISIAGGIAGLTGVMLISQAQLGLEGSVGLVASMGASAVLLFAVPHGPLSQPWPVLGGHLVSAIVGVACSKVIPLPTLAAPIAVGLAIGSMHYLRCIHPPGGATALSAVVGGETVSQLGFQFVITPVLWNAIVILAIAFVFNYPFNWRRYPLALMQRPDKMKADTSTNKQAFEVTNE